MCIRDIIPSAGMEMCQVRIDFGRPLTGKASSSRECAVSLLCRAKSKNNA